MATAAAGKLPKFISGKYFTLLPLILVGASLVTFLLAVVNHGGFGIGVDRLIILLTLSFETFFLPFVIIPLAVTLPLALPWVSYEASDLYALVGENRARQWALVSLLIIMPGMLVLPNYELYQGNALWRELPMMLIMASRGTVFFFVLMMAVLAIPDFTKNVD